jgi:hypothetical protein
MNERIRELWDKAATASAAYPSGQDNSWETQVNFMDKFAELIVRECMDVAKDYTPDTEECEYTWLIHNKIEQHFGVEP